MEIKILNKGRILSDKEMESINGAGLFDPVKCKTGFFSTQECVILYTHCGEFRYCSGVPGKNTCGGQAGEFDGPVECGSKWQRMCSAYVVLS